MRLRLARLRMSEPEGRSAGRAAHSRQQFFGGPGVSRQSVFRLHGFDSDAALLPKNAVDLAYIESGADEQLLQFATLIERQLSNGGCWLSHGSGARDARCE